MLVISGNPVVGFPGATSVRDALAELELLVCIDLYRTDTAELADYVLPGVTGLERDQYPWFTSGHMITPYAVWTDRLVEPPDGCREEGWIIDQIARRLGVVPSPVAAVRALGKLGIRLTPRQTLDLFLRIGPEGDLFGLRRRGWNRRKAWANPRGRFWPSTARPGCCASGCAPRTGASHWVTRCSAPSWAGWRPARYTSKTCHYG